MAFQFPGSIDAARVATFVSTAAWIQGVSASEVSLPPEALDNFLRRHGIGGGRIHGRQTSAQPTAPAPTPPPPPKDEEDDESSSSVDTPGSTLSDSQDDEGDSKTSEEEPDEPADGNAATPTGTPQAGVSPPAVGGGAQGQPGGQDAIAAGGGGGSGGLSPGARIAIGVWTAVGAVAILGLIYFFCRRRRRARLARDEADALRDEELARAMREHQQQQLLQEVQARHMSEAVGTFGAAPFVAAPPPQPRQMSYQPSPLAPPPPAAAPQRAPSGQWMAMPPWQDEPPTWREPHPWRQSQPSVAGARAAAVRPSFAGYPPPPPPASARPEDDRRTETTSDTESTIFAYR
ncbi:hypothetical protein GGS23DRAFT_617093 [Durotheca rogersii]|uniref:uncharacterized protein n=1 Tax=Durotheca rogersii TaxID=419775 RepID=UPI002220F7B9|nr:uncharacterized protein GGS23DRAFT_617093 [Durotheca rogersii]KAI5865984.1 hypothetical protein GGS23DRAFT_617093 [Durotheca rogersii]